MKYYNTVCVKQNPSLHTGSGDLNHCKHMGIGCERQKKPRPDWSTSHTARPYWSASQALAQPLTEDETPWVFFVYVDIPYTHTHI